MPEPGALAYDGLAADALDAPMQLLGEGTSELHGTIIARGLVRRFEEECDGT